MRACGSAYRFPGVPAESRNWPALQARPIARVLTSLGIMRITSWIASIAGTEPPGELIHRPMSARGSSADSSSSCCIRRLPLLSSRTSPSTMIRWCMSRWASSSSSRPASAVCVIAPASSLPVRRPRVFCPEQICCQRSARCGIVNRRAYPARPPDQEPRGDRVAHRDLPGQAQWCRSRRTLAWGQPRRELSQRCHRGHGRAPDLEPGEAPAVGAAPPSSSHAGLHADVLQHLWRALGGLDAAYARRSDTLRPQCPRHRVRFEWSPGRRSPEYTGDQTAFDVALAFGRTDAEILVGIETKYHEWAEPADVPHPTERLHRYRDIAETSGIFKPDWGETHSWEADPTDLARSPAVAFASSARFRPMGRRPLRPRPPEGEPELPECSSGVPEGTRSRTERADVPRADSRGGPRWWSCHSGDRIEVPCALPLVGRWGCSSVSLLAVSASGPVPGARARSKGRSATYHQRLRPGPMRRAVSRGPL